MGFLRREESKEKEDSVDEMPEVPDEFVTLVARRLFDIYGDEIAETVNRSILQQLEPIRKKIEQMDREIQHLKAASDEKIRDLLRSTIEVATESVAERSARKAVDEVVDRTGLSKVEALDDGAKMLRETQMEMVEKLDDVAKVLGKADETLSKISSILKDASSIVEDIDSSLNKTVEQFEAKVNTAVNRAVKQIRENVVVDKGLIESVVSQALSKIVSSKFKDIESNIYEISSRVESLTNAVKELKGLEEVTNIMLEKLGDLEDAIKRQPASPARDITKETFEEAKAAQNVEEFPVE